jgi:uncharacterized protein (DUF1697 family)
VTVFIALLRSVNVGGTGKLPMSDLKKMCEDAGFAKVRTYIASGNVLFESNLSESKIKAILEKQLQSYAGRAIPVLVRTAAEMVAVAEANPFKTTNPARTVAIFLDQAPAKDTLTTVKGQSNEEIKLGKREIYVHYGEGLGNTKLRIPASEFGTARNINTVMKLSALASDSNN